VSSEGDEGYFLDEESLI